MDEKYLTIMLKVIDYVDKIMHNNKKKTVNDVIKFNDVFADNVLLLVLF